MNLLFIVPVETLNMYSSSNLWSLDRSLIFLVSHKLESSVISVRTFQLELTLYYLSSFQLQLSSYQLQLLNTTFQCDQFTIVYLLVIFLTIMYNPTFTVHKLKLNHMCKISSNSNIFILIKNYKFN